MDLYSYDYLIHPNTIVTYLLLALAVIVGLMIIFNGFKYMRDRTNLKYRDLFITMIVVAILSISIGFSNILQQRNSSSQNSQTTEMVKAISRSKHISTSKIYVSSPQLTNGMTVKVGDKFYQATFNSSFNSYQLQPIQLIPTNITYHDKPSFQIGDLNKEYLEILFKFLIGFVVLVIQINISGKGNLAPSNAVDQIQNYVLGGIIGGMIYNQQITTLQFFIVLLIWSLVIFTSRILSRQFSLFHRIFNGEPQNIITNGIVNVDTALKNGMSAADLAFKLRTKGISNFQDVKSAVLEQNGQLTVTTFGDESLSYPIITDGTVNAEVLEKMGHDMDWIEQLAKDSHKEIAQIYLGQYVDDHLVIIPYPTHKKRPWYYELGERVETFSHNHNLTPERIKNAKSLQQLKELSKKRHLGDKSNKDGKKHTNQRGTKGTKEQ
ncbi:hypothetical protein AKUH3B111A_12990 [Apilactobacillus kunkeei]|nr:hypothetical protein AKUH3B103M_13020 [Apilactobacillus kunkeei]CAI2652378.1 hypothetical protein AKUH4B204J_13130 [Apilactobacillus kunkeei]CAI2652737.1 hypothetical protein AKUH3B104X_13020 [Apilactobacillus kunkeei]CAI2655154.1 hypothetical protein AKUH3B111A_12990 [Apilactobacillus kunkeei]CAI2690494.1 hypothetical protein AKUA2103_12320 [Apilactobacillus kunkeei]